MVDKSSFMTISEMAKYRNVTTETLRHYDRIGLFKPKYTDPDTGYRYYSIEQYETLGTIKELHQLGMSLGDIKEYFKNRTVEKSTELLRRQCEMLKKDIQEKQLLAKTLEAKLDFLEELKSLPSRGEPFIRTMPTRYALCFKEWEVEKKDRARAIMRLEELVRNETVAPIIASNRIGACSANGLFELKEDFLVASMVMCGDRIPELECCMEIPAGEYVCVYYHGAFGRYTEVFDSVKEYILKKGYQVADIVYQIYQVDITITSDFEETIIELQIPILSK